MRIPKNRYPKNEVTRGEARSEHAQVANWRKALSQPSQLDLLLRFIVTMELMPKFIGLAITIITVLCVGCSTPYMVDRKRDAADIFTATVGVGVGGKARVGFLQTGIIAQTDLYGLRGGTVVNHYPKLRTEGFPSNHLEIVALLIGFEGFDPDNAIAQKRNKGFLSLHALIFAVHYIHSNPSNYNSQIEIALGLGPAIRLGFNPGELVDFLLGWFGVDIYGDDIGLQNQTDLQPEIIEE